jgi:hypothetical protein
MTKIIRTPTEATGGITEDERERMAAHVKLWTERAFRTAPIEPGKIIPAIEGLYAAAGLKKPRVVIVPSPLVMAFAYGAAAAIWYKRSVVRDATSNATDDAARSVTRATRRATRTATYAFINDDTDAVTREAVEAISSATADSIIDSATFNATYDATDAAAKRATDVATAANGAVGLATDAATAWGTSGRTATAIQDILHGDIRDATDSSVSATAGVAAKAAAYAASHAANNASLTTAYSATRDAIRKATDDAVRNAVTIRIAIGADATADSDVTNGIAGTTRSAVAFAADYAANHIADAIGGPAEKGAASACYSLAGQFGLECAKRWNNAYQGGNMWVAFDSYLTAMRDIIGLRLPEFEKYAFWEQAAIHGGFRVMHPEFCMVSNFPEFIRTDDRNLPHCEDGPSHRWRDGWALYYWHGISVPAEWIEHKEHLTAKTALTWPNIEQRRAACEILGWERILQELKAKVLDKDEDPMIGELVEVALPDLGKQKFLRVVCGTGRKFAIPMPPDIKTALEGNAWTYAVDTQVIEALSART